MRRDYSKDHFLVIDNNLFPEIARTLIKQGVGKVSYYSRHESTFPTLYQMMIGSGFDGVTRCNDPFSIVDEVDCFVFPDITFDGFQVHLDSLGKRVWGARYGADIENWKVEFRQHCRDIGIPVSNYKVVHGVTEAREYLKHHHGDTWLKLSYIRGQAETFGIKKLKLAEPRLEKLARDLGPWKETQEIIIEDTFPDSVEISYDLWSVDGIFPKDALFGIERKGALYGCCKLPYNKLPEQILDLNERMAPTLKSYKYRSNFPIEIRVNKDGDYIALDPATREGFPVFSTKQMMITNFPDVFYFGAEGECIEPEFGKDVTHGMEIVISSEWVATDPKPLYVPKKYRDNVKVRNAAELDGVIWILPQPVPDTTLGSIVGTGKSWQDCEDEIREVSDAIESDGFDCFWDEFEKIREEWAKLTDDYNIKLPKI